MTKKPRFPANKGWTKSKFALLKIENFTVFNHDKVFQLGRTINWLSITIQKHKIRPITQYSSIYIHYSKHMYIYTSMHGYHRVLIDHSSSNFRASSKHQMIKQNRLAQARWRYFLWNRLKQSLIDHSQVFLKQFVLLPFYGVVPCMEKVCMERKAYNNNTVR